MQEFTSNRTSLHQLLVHADIVPSVAGGVAGGLVVLVVLVLILIVNIVLVVAQIYAVTFVLKKTTSKIFFCITLVNTTLSGPEDYVDYERLR